MDHDGPPETDFESFAECYSRVAEDNAYNTYYERPAIRGWLPSDLRGQRVLDVGCAGGNHADWLVAHGARVTAVDRSPTMVKITRGRLRDCPRDRARVIQHDVRVPLTFVEDRAMDVVFCSLTLHYIYDWRPVFREFSRVLVPGGMVVFSTHHPALDSRLPGCKNYYDTELVSQIWEGFTPQPLKVHFYRRSVNAVQCVLRESGFEKPEFDEPTPRPEMASRFPKEYQLLSTTPWFAIYRSWKIG